ncbi:fatty acid desaturase [Akkermansiaceae bacterium]|nr:fatty acid desaturase [Akkermansiaceae bacterium]MDA7645861.1 fatty acid desaturase [bacterium]MDA7537238.1 fatty acid desaturase [Akkermansiaceae bacterium]MDA7639634.1 fatty acid desaturase [Akkermansiaceae bacterium]MDA7646415.1 fatty acid desaturase [Akkermansiaceae bacterium]
MNHRFPFYRVNWVNSSFLFIITALGVIAAPIFLIKHDLNWIMWSMFGFYMIATGLSITLGYHRLFSHLSFKATWPVRLFTLVFGACAFENSVVHWASDHRRHHKHTDHEEDPYDISKGFFWAHIGWILFKLNAPQPIDNVKDLQKDSLVRFQDRHYVAIAFTAGLILPAVAGYFVMGGMIGALGGFLVVGALRVVLVQQSTFFINSLCHTIGNQPYSVRCSARDSWVMALVTYGEGYHNYHHEFQHDFRNGVKAWNFDPTKWSIMVLHKLGLVSNLRRVPESKIIGAEMREAQRKVEAKLAELHAKDGTICEHAMARVDELLTKLKKNLNELESSVSESLEASRSTIRQWQRETRELVRRLGDLRLVNA